jgi:ribonuclease HI
MSEVIIHTDGGARGNPGPAGIGIVFYDNEKKVVFEFKEYIGERTNNFAEYTALIIALEKAKEQGYTKITCFLDSELVVKQLNGQYKIKEPTLQPLAAEVLRYKKDFESVTFAHVRREQNKDADALVNQALDEEEKKQQ